MDEVSATAVEISIHALRGEGDHDIRKRRETTVISIHALRGEGDYELCTKNKRHENFNPRPPWGGRLQKYTNMQCYACT